MSAAKPFVPRGNEGKPAVREAFQRQLLTHVAPTDYGSAYNAVLSVTNIELVPAGRRPWREISLEFA